MKLFSFPWKFTNKKRAADRDYTSFDALSEDAYAYLNEQQEICKTKYKIGGYKNWYYDQVTGKLTFSDDGVVKLIIDYEEVGSVSIKTNTWLWGWANPHVEDIVKTEIAKVRDYGIKYNLPKLMERKWEADESDGWEMTAIAALILQAKGAYRVPNKDNNLYSFMIFKRISWVNEEL